MPITRKKSKALQDAGEGFYISTDPSPLPQNILKKGLIPDEGKEGNKIDKEKISTTKKSQAEQPSEEDSSTATFDISPNNDALQSDTDF